MHLGLVSAAALGLLQASAVHGEAQRMEKDWFGKMVHKTVGRVETFIVGDEDPCETAVRSLLDDDTSSVLETVLESLSFEPCRGRFGLFTEAQVGECLTIQSSPEVEEMIAYGLTDPAMVCAWRPFWTEAKSGHVHGARIDSCELCQRTTEMIEDTLKKQEMEVKLIQQGLKLLCQYLPESTKCKVLEERFDDIVDWIKQGFSPKHVCTKLKLCTALPRPLDVSHVQNLPVVADATADASLCGMCRENGRVMQQFTDTPHGFDLYKSGINSICRLAPDSPSCRFMTTKFDGLVHAFRSGATVDEACAAVQACSVAGPTYLSCVFCEYSANVVKSAIAQGGVQTLPTVKQGLDIMCSALPAQAQCDVMDTGFDQLAEWVQKGKSAEATCEHINMCSPVQAVAVAPAKTDEIECLLCQYTAQVIVQVAKYSQEMVPMVKQGMALLCAQVPEPEFQSECNAIVDRFDKLAELVEGGASASDACIQVQLCTSAKPTATPQLAAPSKEFAALEAKVQAVVATGTADPADEIQCVFCQYTAEIILQVSTYSKEMVPLVKEGMEVLCSRITLPAFQDDCNAVVKQFDKLATLLEQGATPPAACKKVHLCDAAASVSTEEYAALEKQVAVLRTSPTAAAPDSGCVFCKYVAVSIAHARDVSKETLPALKDGLAMLCASIRAPDTRLECTAAVAKFDELVDLIDAGVQPEAACKKMGLCVALSRDTALTTAMDTLEKQVWAVVNDTANPRVDDDSRCAMCQVTASVITQASVYSKDMVPLVKQGLQILCSQIHRPHFQDECEAVVDAFDSLATAVAQGAEGHAACVQVDLCHVAMGSTLDRKHTFVMQKLHGLERDVKALAGKQDVVGCLLCEYTGEVIVQVAQYSADLVPLLKEGLGLVCSRLEGTPIQPECAAVLEKFDQIAEMIEKGESASQACTKVVLCGAPPTPTLAALPMADLERHVAELVAHPSAVSSQEGCLFCTYAAVSIKTIVALDKKDLPRLREAIATMCTFLPPVAECDKVNENFDKLVALVAAGESTEGACEKVELCEIKPHGGPIVVDELLAIM